MLHAMLPDRAEQGPGEAATPAAADHQQVSLSAAQDHPGNHRQKKSWPAGSVCTRSFPVTSGPRAGLLLAAEALVWEPAGPSRPGLG